MIKGLRVIKGADEGRFFPLAAGGASLVIGSSQRHCDVCLNDLYVSRVHFQVETLGEETKFSELESATGTWINGTRATKAELKLGDVIKAGNSELRLDEADEASFSRPMARAMGESLQAPRLDLGRMTELSGHKLGHYELGSMLGQGPYAAVFQAHDTKTGNVVALKVLGSQFPKTDAEMQKFVQAMRARMALKHPNLVPLLGVGRTASYCWIATEFIEGHSVAQKVRDLKHGRKINWHVGLKVAIDIGHVLEFLHQRRVIHGAINPQNILIRNNDETALLGDLFFHAAIEGSVLQETCLEERLLDGTPYLAPEQTLKDSYVDDGCEIFSLGSVVYELLTGKPAFQGSSASAIERHIRESVPEKPRKLNKAIPLEFQATLLRMLSKRAEDRHGTPASLVAELEQFATKRKSDDDE